MSKEEQRLLTPEPETPDVAELEHPTIIRDLSFGDYCDLDRVNVSALLKHRGKCPREARHEQLYGIKETEALVTGHATHAAILEPESFERDYVTMPTAGDFGFGDFRTDASKEKRAAWLEEHKNSITLTAGVYEAAIAMRDSVLTDPFVGQFFAGRGMNEITLTWTDEETRLPCKARIDRFASGAYHGHDVLVDIKTACDLGSDEDLYPLQRAMAKFHYHIRMAWYLDATNLRSPGTFRVFFVWVLNRAPYVCRVTELEEDGLREGRMQYRRLLRQHAECLAANHWPGYAEGVAPLNLPTWAFEMHHEGGLR